MHKVFECGQVRVTLEAPDELESVLDQPLLTVRPRTSEMFDRVVEAVGGPTAFHRPAPGAPATHDFVGTLNYLLLLYTPREEHLPGDRLLPSLQRLTDAQDASEGPRKG